MQNWLVWPVQKIAVPQGRKKQTQECVEGLTMIKFWVRFIWANLFVILVLAIGIVVYKMTPSTVQQNPKQIESVYKDSNLR